MDKLWKNVRAALKKRVPTHSFRMWIEPLELAGGEDGDWTITCPNAFSKKRVQEHFGELIEAELPHEQFRALDPRPGQVVYLSPKRVRVFLDTPKREAA